MTLLADLVRGLAETVRETLPGDRDEARVFLGGFVLGLAIQLVWFSALAFGTVTGLGVR